MSRTPDMSEILRVADSHGSLSEAPGLWKDLVGAWPLQDGGGILARDVSGYRNHGTLTGGPTWAVTEKGRALDFAGSQYVATSANILDSIYTSTTTRLSFTFWFRSSATSEQVLLSSEGWWFFRINRVASSGILEWDVEGGVTDPAASSAAVNDGKWHCASGTLAGRIESIFIDGVPGGTKASVTVGNITSTSRATAIGANWNGGNSSVSSISNVLIHSRALTPSEIAQLYSDPWAMYRLRRQLFRPGFYIPPRKTLKLRRAAKMRERPASFTLNPQSPLAQGLVFAGLGQAPGSLTMRDASAYGNHGTLTNMEPSSDWKWVPQLGRWGAKQRASANSYVQLPIVMSGVYTVSSWIGNTQTTAYLFDARQSDGAGTGYLYVSSGTLTPSSGTTYVNGVDGTAMPNDGEVRHITLAGVTLVTTSLLVLGNRNGSGLAPVSTRQIIGNHGDWLIHSRPLTAPEIRALADPSNVDLRIGATPLILPPRTQYYPAVYVEPSPPTQRFKTYRRTTRALRQRPDSFTLDLQHPLAQGLVFAGLGQGQGGLTMRDSSPYQNHGTLTNMEAGSDWVWVPELGRWGLDLVAASSQWISMPGPLLTDEPFSMSAWMYTADTTNAQTVVAFGNNGSDGVWRMVAGGSTAGDPLQAQKQEDVGGTTQSANSATAYSTSQWFHGTAVFTSNNARSIYLNGSLSGTSSISVNDPTPDYISIGVMRRAALSQYFNGSLSDILIHSRALTLPEIRALADPGNVLLSGLVKPVQRYSYPVAVPYEKNTAGLPSIFTNRGRIITSG